MSFDLKIVDGDLAIGADGDLAKVENTEKLIQDVLKLALTPAGANPFFPWYGSHISKSLIGSSFDLTFLGPMASQQLRNALEIIQTLQKIQSNSGQFVSASELLAAIQEVYVEQNQTDPRYFKVSIKILTKEMTSFTTSFDVTL